MRPIDADALIAEQCGQCDGACEMFDGEKCLSCKANCHCDLREAIDNAPALDCVPVRHGEFGFYRDNITICPFCDGLLSPDWVVCPHCSSIERITLVEPPKEES